MMRPIYVLLGVASLLVAGCASPPPLPGDEAYRAGRFEEAAKLYEQRAQAGDAVAMAKLALLYLQGYGVAKDPPLAIYWLEQAASHGDVASMYNIGALYDFGKVVDADAAKAEYWYRHAAERGYPPAQYNLGAMYANRRTAQDDDVQGLMWLLVAQSRVQTSAPDYNLIRFDKIRCIPLISSRLAPEKIAEAEKRAANWRPAKD